LKPRLRDDHADRFTPGYRPLPAGNHDQTLLRNYVKGIGYQ
jgi:hypothetical protein